MFTKHISLDTKNNHGIADPITLFGILFLVATLGITTYLAADKDSRLDIGSRAKAVLEGEDYNYLRANRVELDTQIKEKRAEKASQEEKDARQERAQATAVAKVNTCNVDGTSYNNGAVAVSGGVGSYKKCNNGSWEDCPTCTITQLTTVPVYLQEEYNKALQGLAEQLEAEEMSISGTDVIQEQKEQQDKVITEIGSQIIQNQAGQNTTISIGKSICAGDNIQTWNGDSWDTISCQYGCSNGVCKKPNENSNVYESVRTGSGSLSNNSCPAGSTWVDNTCVTNQFVSDERGKPSISELWNNFQNQYNTALNDSDLQGLGTYGLGSTSPVVTPPLNVLTSNDPNALDEFNKGALYSGVAGFGTAALTTYLAGGAPLAQFVSANINATISTLPTAAQSAITYGGSALTVGGTAYSSYDCIVNGPESPTCMGFIAGYQTDPIDFTQTLEYSADNLTNGAISLIKPRTTNNIIDGVSSLPTATEFNEQYGSNFLDGVFRQNYDFPVVVEINPDDAIKVAKAFESSGGFNNPNLIFPNQGKNSQTAFFENNGVTYVIKTESPNAIWSNRGGFQERAQAGFDAILTTMDSPNLGVARPSFFTSVNDGNTISISPLIEGSTLGEPEIDIIDDITKNLTRGNVFFQDPGGNIIQNQTGLNVIIDTEGAIPFATRDELLDLLIPEAAALRNVLGPTPPISEDIFAQYRNR